MEKEYPLVVGALLAATVLGVVGVVRFNRSLAVAHNSIREMASMGNDQSSEQADPPHWGRLSLTYRIANCPSTLDCAAANQTVREAAAAWDAISALSLVEVSRGGEIVISWVDGEHGDGSPLDGLGGYAAHAIYPYNDGADALDGDIHLDDAENWVVGDPSAPFPEQAHLLTIVMHELGHALGLPHSEDAAALMWPAYTGPRGLSRSDRAAIQAIYGSPRAYP